MQLIWLKDKLSKAKIQDYRALLEIQKLVEIYGGSIFYLTEKQYAQKMVGRSKSPILLVKGDTHEMRTDFADCLKRLDVIEPRLVTNMRPTVYAPIGFQFELPNQSIKASKAELLRYKNYSDDTRPNRSKSCRVQNGQARPPPRDMDFEIFEKTDRQRSRNQSSRRRGQPTVDQAVHKQDRRSNLRVIQTSRSGLKVKNEIADDIADQNRPRDVKKGYGIRKASNSPEKKADKPIKKKLKKNANLKKLANKKELHSESRPKVKRNKVTNIVDTLPAETVKHGNVRIDSKEELLEKGKEIRRLREEVTTLASNQKLQGFYLVAENVVSTDDKSQVESEFKHLMHSNKELRQRKVSSNVSKTATQFDDKSVQINEAPYQMIFPRVKYPRGYGPQEDESASVITGNFQTQEPEHDTWLKESPQKVDNRDTSGYSTTVPTVAATHKGPKSVISTGKSKKSKKSHKVSFKKSKGVSRDSVLDHSDSAMFDNSSYQSSDPLEGYDSEDSDFYELEDYDEVPMTFDQPKARSSVNRNTDERPDAANKQPPAPHRQQPVPVKEERASQPRLEPTPSVVVMQEPPSSVQKKGHFKPITLESEFQVSKLEDIKLLEANKDPKESQVPPGLSDANGYGLHTPPFHRAETSQFIAESNEEYIDESKDPGKDQKSLKISPKGQDRMSLPESLNHQPPEPSYDQIEKPKTPTTEPANHPLEPTKPTEVEQELPATVDDKPPVPKDEPVQGSRIKDLLKAMPQPKKPVEATTKQPAQQEQTAPASKDATKTPLVHDASKPQPSAITKSELWPKPAPQQANKTTASTINGGNSVVKSDEKVAEEQVKPKPLASTLKENTFLRKEQKLEPPVKPEEPKSALKDNPFLKKETVTRDAKDASEPVKDQNDQLQAKIGSTLKENPFVRQSEEARRKLEEAKLKEEEARKKAEPEVKSMVANLKGLWK